MRLTRRSLFGLLAAAATAKVLPAPTKAERAIEAVKSSPTIDGWTTLSPPIHIGDTFTLPMRYTLTTTGNGTIGSWVPEEYIVLNDVVHQP